MDMDTQLQQSASGPIFPQIKIKSKIYFDWENKYNKSILRHFGGVQYGSDLWYPRHWNVIKKAVVKSHISRLCVQDMYQFDRRVTAITWHESVPNMVAAATKSGDMTVLHGSLEGGENGFLKFGEKFRTKGSGPSGSILSMKFDTEKKEQIFVAGMEGTVARLNIEYKNDNHIYENSGKYEIWFTAMDVSMTRKLIAAGDTRGQLFLIPVDDSAGNKVFTRCNQLHKKVKIHHCEFHPRDPNLLITAGLDRMVKLWDLRNFEEHKPLKILQHNTGCNVARFSPSDGTRLLTNDQASEIRVYHGPLWDEPLIIEQHHRQFQHLTPMKANWHPLTPTIVVGLYPPGRDKTVRRPLQFIDADTGDLVQEIDSPNNGIISLNHFNPTGEILASSTGGKFVLWQSMSTPELSIPPEGDVGRGRKTTIGKRLSDAMVNVLRGATRAARRGDGSENDSDEDSKPSKKKAKVETRSKVKDVKGKGKKK